MRIEGDEHEEDVPPPNNVIEDITDGDEETEDDWDLKETLPSGATDVRHSFHGDFLIIQ